MTKGTAVMAKFQNALALSSSSSLPPAAPLSAEQLRVLEASATPAPWVVEEQDGGDYGERSYITGHITSPAHTYCGNRVERTDSILAPASMTRNDAEFVVAVRNALPALLARLATLEAAHTRLVEALPTNEQLRDIQWAVGGYCPNPACDGFHDDDQIIPHARSCWIATLLAVLPATTEGGK